MRKFWWLVVWLMVGVQAWAQPTYVMSNRTVTDCRAFFDDSGANTVAGGNYANNENFTFVILNPQATQIILTFQSFCTEQILDVLRVFNGPDTNSALLGSFSGPNIVIPPLVATNGAMTIHFRSDANVTCTGWNAYWYSIVPPPIPPAIDSVRASCLTTLIDITLDSTVHCDSVMASAFVLTGTPARTIVNAQALSCVNDSTRRVRLTVNTPFDQCATYGLSWNLNLLDRCDSLYTFLLNSNFSINDCPLTASTTVLDDSLCIGECTLISAQGQGGDCNYTYQWSNGLPPTAGPHLVCPPAGLTTYTVIVNDGNNNGPDTLQIPILVTTPPEAGADTLVCLQSGPFNLAGRASPAGGVFFGRGITAAAAGTFRPDSARAGTHRVFYSVNGCADSLTIQVVDVDPGPTQGSCPGGPPFAMTGFSPPGGTWSGTNISPAGMYTPPATPGVDSVYYNFAGCSRLKIINIDTIDMRKIDTICQSSPPYTLVFQPLGGTWTGVALVNPLLGIIDPQLTTAGNHILVYNLNGCIDTLRLHIKAIEAGPGFITCPLRAPFNLNAGVPAGGYWTGTGITDSLAGTFNPGVNGTGNSNVTLMYHVDGCIDSLVVNLVRTNIVGDTLRRCITSGNLGLGQANTGRTPAGGTWSGPGVNPAGNGTFNAVTAGIGFHRLYYTANGCVDSLVVEVQPIPNAQADTTVCILSGPFSLRSSYAGGRWTGAGITDSLAGVFSPAVAGLGAHRIYQRLQGGCIDSLLVTVTPLPVIAFSGIDTVVCFRDTAITVTATPVGGLFSGQGMLGNEFRPRLAGVGSHWIYYRAGSGPCERTDSFRVVVRDSLRLTLSASADTLCSGEPLLLIAQLNGGLPSRALVWQPGGSTSDSLSLRPTASAWYVVEASDGCSNTQRDSVYIYVHPEVIYTLSQTEIDCFDSSGTGQVNFAIGSPYRVEWLTNPPLLSNELQAKQGSYRVLITDTLTGCFRLDTLVLVSFPAVSANFSPNPNRRGCYDLAEADLVFIDLSSGGITGLWDFGNGITEPYVPGQYPRQLYADTGRFEISLLIENAAGCASRFSRVICVQARPRILVPNAFTPNRDLTNDRFKVVTVGITSLRITIFDRWGQPVFEGNGIDFTWDGTKNGAELPNGAYPFVIYYTDFTSGEQRVQKGVVRLIR
ncbi:MAG: hypothetical protein C0424_12660 [Sphingobacteriaceae bacterium]|nr:hypothetical protein [Sphingobacteriaceae bacterium]